MTERSTVPPRHGCPDALVELTARVVVAACAADPRDRALWIGDPRGADALAARVARLDRHDSLRDDATDASIVVLHHILGTIGPADQRSLLARAGALLPERGLLVIGDRMWSLPPDMLDDLDAYGADRANVPLIASLEGWLRTAGFLPDTHRFTPGVGVIVAVRA